jgi:integrase
VARLEGVLRGLDLTILRVFTRCGLRAGEVFGLQVGDLQPDKTLKICRTFSKGQVGPLKTRTSGKPVAVSDSLYGELRELIENLKDRSAEARLFPSPVKRGSAIMPLRSENWLKRVLKPAAKRLGFEITLHPLRRGWVSRLEGMSRNCESSLLRSRLLAGFADLG